VTDNCRFAVFGVLAGAFALAGCGADAGGESASQTKEALTVSCDIGLSYSGGTWKEKAFANVNSACPSTTTFGFGDPSDIPIMFDNNEIATYGTTASGDRLGRFFIDRDRSRGWNTGDTFTRFMPSPLTTDQPFVMQVVPKHLVGSTCQGPSGLQIAVSVVGVKRGSTWYIDGNNNGTWDGTSQCDITGSFGTASDIPTPVGGMIGSSGGISGSSLVWNFDADGSLNWSGAPPDYSLTAFGTDTMRPFSDASSQTMGAQNGADVYLDKNGDLVWSGTPTDIGVSGYLTSSSWRFVGWWTNTIVQ
jgi:hypothetical protein